MHAISVSSPEPMDQAIRQSPSISRAHELPITGYLRLWQIVGRPAAKKSAAIPAIFPVCRSTWWAGVKSGKYPQPVKLSERITAWRVEDIRSLIAGSSMIVSITGADDAAVG
jgi:prophage regulatory protein